MSRSIRWLAAGVALACLCGCASFPRKGRPALEGTWKNPFGVKWTIREDGTFDVDFNKDGERDAWGTLFAAGTTMTISEMSGKVPPDCTGSGVYRFRRTAESLHFELVRDDCAFRSSSVVMEWERKKPKGG